MPETTKYKATGRRKEAVARVELLPGTGKILVNKREFNDYFIRETDRIIITQPLELTGNLNKYDMHIRVNGGGLTGQAGAVRHGIARALLLADEKLRETLRKGAFLTRDPRMKERKKYGRKGARRRFQWTKR
jgi:small subunit ribosomal protein S9